MEASFASTSLTGPTPSEHAGVVEIGNDLLVSITPLIGGDSPSIRAFGNESNAIRISCVRRYATLLAAMSARATFMGSLARTGTLLLTQTSLGNTLTITGTGAVRMPSPSPQLKGRSVAFTFQFSVPLVSAATT